MPDEVLPAWRTAIIRSAHVDDPTPHDSDMHWVGEILAKDGELALLWMREALVAAQSGMGGICLEDVGREAVSGMSKRQRMALLDDAAKIGVTPVSQFFAMAWAPACVGDDVDLYKRLLECESLQHAHGRPLAGEFTPAWEAKALAALDAGSDDYDEEWVAFWGASDNAGAAFIGEMSDYLEGRLRKFERLAKHSNSSLRTIGECGMARLGKQRRDALRQESRERKRGLADP